MGTQRKLPAYIYLIADQSLSFPHLPQHTLTSHSIAAIWYSHSRFPKPDWTEVHPPRAEIHSCEHSSTCSTTSTSLSVLIRLERHRRVTGYPPPHPILTYPHLRRLATFVLLLLHQLRRSGRRTRLFRPSQLPRLCKRRFLEATLPILEGPGGVQGTGLPLRSMAQRGWSGGVEGQDDWCCWQWLQLVGPSSQQVER
jgi:hypothetical protein